MAGSRPCAAADCRQPFQKSGKRMYCSEACARATKNRRQGKTYKGLGKETRKILRDLGHDRAPSERSGPEEYHVLIPPRRDR